MANMSRESWGSYPSNAANGVPHTFAGFKRGFLIKTAFPGTGGSDASHHHKKPACSCDADADADGGKYVFDTTNGQFTYLIACMSCFCASAKTRKPNDSKWANEQLEEVLAAITTTIDDTISGQTTKLVRNAAR